MAGDRIGQLLGQRKTLKWRITAVLLIAALLPLMLSGFGSWVVFRGILERKSSEQMRSLVSSHARAIEDHLTQRVRLLQLTANSYSYEEISRIGQLQRTLSNLNQSSNQSFIDLGVIDASGDHVAYIGPYDLQERNYSDEGWFREVIVSGTYISDVFLGFRQVPHCVIAVNAGDDSRQWILRATINSNKFDGLVSAEVLGEGSDAYILNRDGRYQTTPRAGSVLDHADELSISYHAGVQEQRVQTEQSTRVLMTTWINDQRWVLAVEQDLDAIQAPVDRAIADGAVVVAIALLLLVVTTIVATWHLTDRIDKANAQREEMSRAFMRSAKLASIGELATGLAHEINNPLAIISAEQTNISDILNDPKAIREEREQALDSSDRIKAQVQRCANITRKMLQFGRNEQSRPQPTDINPRLTEIVELMRRRASVRNVEITLEADDDLPDVLLDPIELEQVLVNLINNSIDALPDGGEIVVSAYPDGELMHLEVTDNGVGIQAEDPERIFEPFFTTKPVGKGTGLGLSVSYGIVQSWDGEIRVESKRGKGTTMHIFVPLDPHVGTKDSSRGQS